MTNRVMINATTKRVHHIIDERGEFPVTAPFEWVDVADEFDRTWVWDGADYVAPTTPVPTEAERIAAVKERARAHILAVIPAWKQSNLNARQNELNKAARTRALTTEEQADEAAMETLWSWVKVVRAESDAAELAGTPADDVNFTVFGG